MRGTGRRGRGTTTGEQLPDHPGETTPIPIHAVRGGTAFAGGDAEVGQVAGAGVVEHDVRGSHVVVRDARCVGGDERPADLLHQAADPSQRPQAVGHQGLAGGAAVEEAEHQVGAAWLAPVVVQRDDVRVLEAGHELRLGFEAAYEVAGVGQVGPNGLDRHPALSAWLHRRVHAAEGAFTDGLVDDVAPERPAPLAAVLCRHADGHGALEGHEVGRRLEPRLLGEVHTEVLVAPQRLDLTTVGLQRLEQQRQWALSERVLDGERFEVGQGAGMVADRDERSRPLLPGPQVERLEASGLRDRPPLVGELAEGPVPPEGDGGVVGRDRLVGQSGVARGHQRLELGSVGRRGLGVETHQVAVRCRGHRAVVQCRPQAGDVGLDRAGGAVGSVDVGPERVDQAVHAHDLPAVGQEHTEQTSLLGPADGHRHLVTFDLEGAEPSVSHRSPPLLVGRGHRPTEHAAPGLQPVNSRGVVARLQPGSVTTRPAGRDPEPSDKEQTCT